VLISSHVLAEVAQTVDQVPIITDGRLVTHATPAELAGHATTVVQVGSPQARELHALLVASGARPDLVGADRLTVPDVTTETVGQLAATHGIVLSELRAQTASLEDLFLGLTGTSAATRTGKAAA
jgi:ABC-2 type transport system ATP-binding protein